jgi:hypothetical protein
LPSHRCRIGSVQSTSRASRVATVHRKGNRSINQSINRSIDQSIDQSINRSLGCLFACLSNIDQRHVLQHKHQPTHPNQPMRSPHHAIAASCDAAACSDAWLHPTIDMRAHACVEADSRWNCKTTAAEICAIASNSGR